MSNDIQSRMVSPADAKRFLSKSYHAGQIKTIEDLEARIYGLPSSEFLSKADAPVLTSTTGVRNILYGQRLWRQINVGFNALGAIGAKPWDTSGYRAITAAAATTSPGVAENATLPETIKPTIAPVDITPSSSAVTFNQSDLESMLEGKDDTIAWADLVQYMSDEFKNRMNRAILATNDTVPSTGLNSLDRIVGSYAEIAYGKVDNSAVLDAGDLDIYGLDRDAAASWADAYVNGQAFGSGDRTLALSHIDAVFTNCRPYWENRSNENKVIITGDDTLERIQQLMAAQVRYGDPGTKKVQFTVNGVQTVSGAEAGFDVASYKGVPIIPDGNVLQDTLSRIYTLDLDNIHLGTLTPPQYLESGDFFANGYIGKEGMYYMHGELVCTKFKGHGKVRDLQ